jgi:hypothetical protein
MDMPDYEHLRKIMLEMIEQYGQHKFLNNTDIKNLHSKKQIDKRGFFIKAKSSQHSNGQTSNSIPRPFQPKKSVEAMGRNDNQTNSVASGNNFLQVCTNSISVMENSQFGRQASNNLNSKSRILVIYEDDINGGKEENKYEVIVMKRSSKSPYQS